MGRDQASRLDGCDRERSRHRNAGRRQASHRSSAAVALRGATAGSERGRAAASGCRCGHRALSDRRGSSRSAEPGPLNSASFSTRRKTLCARRVGRRVERGDAQRFDQLRHARGASGSMHSCATESRGSQTNPRRAQRAARAKQRKLVAPVPCPVRQHSARESDHRRAASQQQARCRPGSTRRSGVRSSALVGRDAQHAHQVQRRGVRADEDVLPVVEHDAVHARPRARGRRAGRPSRTP